MSSEQKKTSGQSTEDYPDVYTKIPPSVQEKKPGQLSQEQINQFFNEVGIFSVVCHEIIKRVLLAVAQSRSLHVVHEAYLCES